uniref:Uncharacterized protein n=1 Tax=Globisporangium ultimum (strain ATCC 200006 / CBS 805.95 / DAOM BR144) TaxID=431595 RepID=K3WQD0_GLOUD
MNVFAYVWLLTNFLRTGLAVHTLDIYHTVEPNVYVNFGPYAYPVNTFYKWSGTNVTSANDIALWSYKFDTTSLALRAFAEYLQVDTFPPCVLYRGECHGDPGSEISPPTAFSMLDSLVTAFQNATAPAATAETAPSIPLRPQTMHLDANYEYYDRVHHYVAPKVFQSPLWRTCRALYYNPDVLSSVAAAAAANLASSRPRELQQNSISATVVDVCSMEYGGVRPYFCPTLWARFDHSCRPWKSNCVAIGRVSTHLTTRLGKLIDEYPNATIDLTIIEGSKGLDIHRGGRVFVGEAANDIVTLFRVRNCSPSSTLCETTIVDDYRYEGESFTTDILGWHTIVMLLRGAAQAYYWLRVVALYLGCYFAVAARRDKTERPGFFTRIRRAIVMCLKVPSQVIIYGSTFPLACYLIAHIIDAPLVYQFTAQKFSSFNGLFKLTLMELITVSSVQMRNVWVLAGAAHIIVRIATQRGWSPLHGIWGLPQFSIALISSITIVSQFRYISLRSMPIRSVQRIDMISRLHPPIEDMLNENGGSGKSTLGGVFLDLKAVCFSSLALFVVACTFSLVLRCVCRRIHVQFIFARSFSFVPLSAGVLWPTSSLAVSWRDDLFKFNRLERALTNYDVPPSIAQLESQQLEGPMNISTLDERSELAEATMYLMNITMLSDPIVYLSWRWYSSKTLLGYFRSSETKRVYLVPMVRTLARSDLSWAHFSCVRTVAADELTWAEIITCG